MKVNGDKLSFRNPFLLAAERTPVRPHISCKARHNAAFASKENQSVKRNFERFASVAFSFMMFTAILRPLEFRLWLFQSKTARCYELQPRMIRDMSSSIMSDKNNLGLSVHSADEAFECYYVMLWCVPENNAFSYDSIKATCSRLLLPTCRKIYYYIY